MHLPEPKPAHNTGDDNAGDGDYGDDGDDMRQRVHREAGAALDRVLVRELEEVADRFLCGCALSEMRTMLINRDTYSSDHRRPETEVNANGCPGMPHHNRDGDDDDSAVREVLRECILHDLIRAKSLSEQNSAEDDNDDDDGSSQSSSSSPSPTEQHGEQDEFQFVQEVLMRYAQPNPSGN